MDNIVCLHTPEDNRNYYVFGYYGSITTAYDEDSVCRVGEKELDEYVRQSDIDLHIYSDSGFVLNYAELQSLLVDPNLLDAGIIAPAHHHELGTLLAMGVYFDNTTARGIRLYGVSRAVSELETYLGECHLDVIEDLPDTVTRALAVLLLSEGYDFIHSFSGVVTFIGSMKEFVESEDYTPTVTDTLVATSIFRHKFKNTLPPDIAAAIGRAFDKTLPLLWWARGV